MIDERRYVRSATRGGTATVHKESHVKRQIHAHRYRGDNPKYAMVISHGIAGHGGVYDAFCEMHAEKGVDIWAYDAPGHGRSTYLQPRGQWTLEAWVDAAVMYAEHVQQESGLPVFALGSSLGGAAAFNSLQSEAVSGLVLMGAPAIPGTAMVERMGQGFKDPGFVQALKSLGRAARFDIGMYFDFDKDYGYPGAAANLRLDPYLTWSYDLASWASVFQYEPAVAPSENTKPVLISAGENDPIATPAVVEAIAAAVSGPVEVKLMADAGHQLMQFHTEPYSALVHEWILQQL